MKQAVLAAVPDKGNAMIFSKFCFRTFVLGLVVTISTAALASDSAYKTIELKTFPGESTVSLAALTDKPIYLKFWATWCKPCMKQMPHFEQIAQKYADDINVVAVNININEEKTRIQQVIQRFGLTMPIWLDNEGELGVALGLVGTPYSVLIDQQGQVIYTTHSADADLDKRLAMLAAGQTPSLEPAGIPQTEQTAERLRPWKTGEHLVFFTATWCDWYLADTRPEMADRCQTAQERLKSVYQRLPDKPWQGVVNHLWTDDKALNDFQKRYVPPIDFRIDHGGVLFNHFSIRDIPTLLWINDGKVVERITDFKNTKEIVKRLQSRQ